jgi:hypothetical protein
LDVDRRSAHARPIGPVAALPRHCGRSTATLAAPKRDGMLRKRNARAMKRTPKMKTAPAGGRRYRVRLDVVQLSC